MREIIRKICAFFLAFMVMLSTMSFTVDMHYCGDSLVDTAILSKAKTCGMESMTDNSANCEIIVTNCCTNSQIVYEGQDELNILFDDLSPDEQSFLIAFTFTYVDLFEGLEEQIVPLKLYSPPRVVRDIQKLDEVYII